MDTSEELAKGLNNDTIAYTVVSGNTPPQSGTWTTIKGVGYAKVVKCVHTGFGSAYLYYDKVGVKS
jgi:hypothetical protein